MDCICTIIYFTSIPWLEVSVPVEPDVVVRPDKPEVYVCNSDVLLQASSVAQCSAGLGSYLVSPCSLRFLLANFVLTGKEKKTII